MDFDEEENNNINSIDQDLLMFSKENQQDYFSVKDSVIFLVDALSQNFTEVFKIAEFFLKTKIVSNENDLFSFIIYNSNTTSNFSNFEGVNKLISMSAPDAKMIRELKSAYLSLKDQEIQEKIHLFSSDRDNSLNEALWVAQNEFSQLKSSVKLIKRIFLFTSRDNPMTKESYNKAIENIINNNEKAKEFLLSKLSKSKGINANSINGLNNLSFIYDHNQERLKTIQRAKDLIESDIVIELFPISEEFKIDNFYCDIVSFNNEEDEQTIKAMFSSVNIKERIRDITKRIRKKDIKKRTLGKLSFTITKDLNFEVNFYTNIAKATKTKTGKVDSETNKQLYTFTRTIDKETSEVLYKKQISSYQQYGKIKIDFTAEDMSKIKSSETPGITLLGFKSRKLIKDFHNVRTSYFIYPNEYYSAGASRIFSSMINQLVVKDKVAIVKFVPREGSIVRICALFPQKEKFDEDYFQTPPGFNLIALPFADEIRKNEDILAKVKDYNATIKKKKVIPNITDVKVFIELMKKLYIKNFNSRNFENYYLQKFFAVIESVALQEEDSSDKLTDLTKLPDEAYEFLKEAENNVIDNFEGHLLFKHEDKKKKVKSTKSKSQKEEDLYISQENNDIEEVPEKKIKKTKNSKKEQMIDYSSDEEDSNIKKEEGKKSNKRKKIVLSSQDTNNSINKSKINKATKDKSGKTNNDDFINSDVDEGLSQKETWNESYDDCIKEKKNPKKRNNSKKSKKSDLSEISEIDKIISLEKGHEYYDDTKLMILIEENRLKNLKISVLKDILKARKVDFSSKLKKKDLLNKLSKFINNDESESN